MSTCQLSLRAFIAEDNHPFGDVTSLLDVFSNGVSSL